MQLLKLTVLSSLLLAFVINLASCEKDDEKSKVTLYVKTNIPATGAQIAPTASPSAGIGSLSVSYDKRGGVLNYTISWSGLTDSVLAIRINGPAPVSYSALDTAFVRQITPVGTTFIPSTSYITSPTTKAYYSLQEFVGTASKALYPSSGSYTGTLLVDGVKVKEQDLLNSLYYITIHTKTYTTPPPYTALNPAYPAPFLFRWFGEIRAQIKFQ